MGLIDRAVVLALPVVPRFIVRRIAGRYVAGPSPEDAFRVVADLNRRGVEGTIDHLGEEIRRIEEAGEAVAAYEGLLEAIASRGLRANVSVKLTQFGLKLDPAVAARGARRVVEAARRLQNFVRIDMEDRTCTDATIGIYRELRRDFDNVGLVLQAYLRRSHADVEALAPLTPSWRLCKGIYREPRSAAYQDMAIINRSYSVLLERMLELGSRVGIATHDEKLVFEAMALVRRLGTDPSRFEFQMLLGVDEELRDIIIAAGHRMRVYVPYGKDWYAYCRRRLRENPRIAGHVLRNLLRSSGRRGRPGA